MNNGKKSALVAMWNRHRCLDEVAKRSGLPQSEIVAFLAKRRGYPGPIPSSATQIKEVSFVQQQRTSIPITLPRVRFLESTLKFADTDI